MYKHIGSSNEEPNHEDCGNCKYNQAMAKNEKYDHKDHFHIPKVVMEKITGPFENLSKKELLENVKDGKTQNTNESFKSTVWNILPKAGFANRKVVDLTAYAAVCFYDGKIAALLLDVLSSLGIPIGEKMIQWGIREDNLRGKKRKWKCEHAKNRKRSKRNSKDEEEDMDDNPYQPGLGAY